MNERAEKIDWLRRQIRMKVVWLGSHGPGTKRPWPHTDIEAKQTDLEMLHLILRDYEERLTEKPAADEASQ